MLCGVDYLTQHALCDGEGECGSSSHPPAGGQIGQLCSQHFHDHLVVQGQVEVVLVQELRQTQQAHRASPQVPWH